MNVPTPTTAKDAPRSPGILGRWPSALGLAVAALQLARDPDTETLATVVGVAALLLAPRAGLVLAGVVLAGHSAWDVVHYRRNRVVHRSLAEFCVLLDVPLGVGAVVLAVAG